MKVGEVCGVAYQGVNFIIKCVIKKLITEVQLQSDLSKLYRSYQHYRPNLRTYIYTHTHTCTYIHTHLLHSLDL
jgi:hypothetical protein